MTSNPRPAIPRATRRKLREEARERCCLCGRLINIEEIGSDPGQFDLHHVVYVTEGGGNDPDNLVLVNPDCHRRIHAARRQHASEELRQRYTPERLRAAKRHWVQMRDIVPQHLSCKAEHETDANGKIASVTFWIASLNLEYQITVSESTKIGELAEFICCSIMRRLAEFADSAPFDYGFEGAKLSGMGLCLDTRPGVELPASHSVGDLDAPSGARLVALVDFERVALRMVSGNKVPEQ